ncbi:hypothetical protein LX36DRAFT_174030 [Colletotrichum falcatum]|nr:hypothetical protein LX36DRAFT_174030 [Colletotrichum falcatum]
MDGRGASNLEIGVGRKLSREMGDEERKTRECDRQGGRGQCRRNKCGYHQDLDGRADRCNWVRQAKHRPRCTTRYVPFGRYLGTEQHTQQRGWRQEEPCWIVGCPRCRRACATQTMIVTRMDQGCLGRGLVYPMPAGRKEQTGTGTRGRNEKPGKSGRWRARKEEREREMGWRGGKWVRKRGGSVATGKGNAVEQKSVKLRSWLVAADLRERERQVGSNRCLPTAGRQRHT